MTISSSTNRVEYTATSSQTVFAYTFRILLNTDLEVYQEGTLKTLTTDYTVSGVGDAGGGNVTLVTGATTNDKIIIIRVMPLTQLTDYVENDPFPAETHETALDKVTMITHQLLETLGRAIKLPITSPLEDIDIPVPGGGKHLRWNTGGTALELVTVSEAAISSPITTKGDVIQGGTSGTPERLAIGAAGAILYVATDLLAYLSAATNGQILQLVSGIPGWIGGLRLVGTNDTEATTQSTSNTDILTVGSLSIAKTDPFIVVGAMKKDAGAADTARISLKLNTQTEVTTLAIWSSSSAAEERGSFWFLVGPHDGTYTRSVIGLVVSSGGINIVTDSNNAIPDAAITSVVIEGLVDNASITMGVDSVRVYALGST